MFIHTSCLLFSSFLCSWQTCILTFMLYLLLLLFILILKVCYFIFTFIFIILLHYVLLLKYFHTVFPFFFISFLILNLLICFYLTSNYLHIFGLPLCFSPSFSKKHRKSTFMYLHVSLKITFYLYVRLWISLFCA